ncbi:MAG: hypothetical protein HY718_07835 [Planctomycetes bacterium]|nr:hypothetical protein [Planctomycetota bacterium]
MTGRIVSWASLVAVAVQTATAQPATAPADVWQRSDAGETLIVPMANAPFPHESRKDGFKTRDKVFPRRRRWPNDGRIISGTADEMS